MLPYFCTVSFDIFRLVPCHTQLFTWVYIMGELLLNFHLSHTPSNLVEVPQPVYQAAQSGIPVDGLAVHRH